MASNVWLRRAFRIATLPARSDPCGIQPVSSTPCPDTVWGPRSSRGEERNTRTHLYGTILEMLITRPAGVLILDPRVFHRPFLGRWHMPPTLAVLVGEPRQSPVRLRPSTAGPPTYTRYHPSSRRQLAVVKSLISQASRLELPRSRLSWCFFFFSHSFSLLFSCFLHRPD